MSAAAIVVGDSHPRSVQCQARLGHMDIPGYDDAIGTVLHLYTVSRKIDWRIAVMIFEHLGGCSDHQEDGGTESSTQRKYSKCLPGPSTLMPVWSIRKRARPCHVTATAEDRTSTRPTSR